MEWTLAILWFAYVFYVARTPEVDLFAHLFWALCALGAVSVLAPLRYLM